MCACVGAHCIIVVVVVVVVVVVAVVVVRIIAAACPVAAEGLLRAAASACDETGTGRSRGDRVRERGGVVHIRCLRCAFDS